MNDEVKRRLRPAVYPLLHAWQWFYDHTRYKIRRHRIQRSIPKKGTVIVQDAYGIRFVLYPFDRPNAAYLIEREHDAREFRVIPRLVRPGDIALDIGANIGFYTVLLSRSCGPTGKVWAFEPVPETFWRLRETLALNRIENVEAIQAAIAQRSEKTKMNVFDSQYAEWNTLGAPSARQVNGKRIEASRSIEVQAFSLDQFCEQRKIERINFLKVDVEGFELSVFKGAERLLRHRKIDYICFEISKGPLSDAGAQSREVFELLDGWGYQGYSFDTEKGRFEGPVRDTPVEWSNFFASHTNLTTLIETSLFGRGEQVR